MAGTRLGEQPCEALGLGSRLMEGGRPMGNRRGMPADVLLPNSQLSASPNYQHQPRTTFPHTPAAGVSIGFGTKPFCAGSNLVINNVALLTLPKMAEIAISGLRTFETVS